jgi:hypothetical protein
MCEFVHINSDFFCGETLGFAVLSVFVLPYLYKVMRCGKQIQPTPLSILWQTVPFVWHEPVRLGSV